MLKDKENITASPSSLGACGEGSPDEISHLFARDPSRCSEKRGEQLQEKKRVWIFILGLTAVFSAYASSPASTDYVNAQIAILQAQINQIMQGQR